MKPQQYLKFRHVWSHFFFFFSNVKRLKHASHEQQERQTCFPRSYLEFKKASANTHTQHHHHHPRSFKAASVFVCLCVSVGQIQEPTHQLALTVHTEHSRISNDPLFYQIECRIKKWDTNKPPYPNITVTYRRQRATLTPSQHSGMAAVRSLSAEEAEEEEGAARPLLFFRDQVLVGARRDGGLYGDAAVFVFSALPPTTLLFCALSPLLFLTHPSPLAHVFTGAEPMRVGGAADDWLGGLPPLTANGRSSHQHHCSSSDVVYLFSSPTLWCSSLWTDMIVCDVEQIFLHSAHYHTDNYQALLKKKTRKNWHSLKKCILTSLYAKHFNHLVRFVQAF